MKVKDFQKVYEHAKTVDIMEDDFFGCAGYFWLSLTTAQSRKMYELLLTQGAKETVTRKGDTCIQLKNGLAIVKIW